METTKIGKGQPGIPIKGDFIGRYWGESWTYIKTVVDVVREPILILNKDLRVLAANESFYKTFQVEPSETEKKIVYELGNGQWDIPALRKLLENVLPKHTFFKGFEVDHMFPAPIILLAMEDVTEMMAVAETLAGHTNQLETMLAERTKKLEAHIQELEKKVNELDKKT